MENIQDSDYILYKAMSQLVVDGLSAPLGLISTKCLQAIAEYEKLKQKFLGSETYEDVGDNSNKLQKSAKELVKLLALHDRIEKMAKRNNERLVLFKSKLDQMGIYNDKVDKKTLQGALSVESKNVSEKNINLNPIENEGLVYKFFAGQILAFKDDRLDFSIESNAEVLRIAGADFIGEIVKTFPYSVATIPDEYLFFSNVKNNVLKECVLFVSAKIKEQNLMESNEELGGLLSNSGRLSSIFEFAEELKNYFNVRVKQCLKQNVPEMAGEIDNYLRCNEYSEFLPASKRVAPLANGLAGETVKNEEEESEEIRKEREKEAQKTLSREELLDLMLSDEDDELEDLQEDFEQKEDERRIAEKSVEEEKDKALQEEIQKELEFQLRKNDVVDD